MLGNLFHILVDILGQVLLVEQRLKAGQERARDVLDLGLGKFGSLVAFEDGVDDGGLAVEQRLADNG